MFILDKCDIGDVIEFRNPFPPHQTYHGLICRNAENKVHGGRYFFVPQLHYVASMDDAIVYFRLKNPKAKLQIYSKRQTKITLVSSSFLSYDDAQNSPLLCFGYIFEFKQRKKWYYPKETIRFVHTQCRRNNYNECFVNLECFEIYFFKHKFVLQSSVSETVQLLLSRMQKNGIHALPYGVYHGTFNSAIIIDTTKKEG